MHALKPTDHVEFRALCPLGMATIYQYHHVHSLQPGPIPKCPTLQLKTIPFSMWLPFGFQYFGEMKFPFHKIQTGKASLVPIFPFQVLYSISFYRHNELSFQPLTFLQKIYPISCIAGIFPWKYMYLNIAVRHIFEGTREYVCEAASKPPK